MRRRVVIAIDPDVDMSGVARVDGKDTIWADRLPFPMLVDYLKGVKNECQRTGATLQVYVEATWQITHHWHIKPTDSKAVAAAKGRSVGAMQEVGKLLVEWCEHLEICVFAQPPFRKCWKGKDGKITHDEITFITGWNKKRSNQEERDALLIAWVAAGFPLKVKI